MRSSQQRSVRGVEKIETDTAGNLEGNPRRMCLDSIVVDHFPLDRAGLETLKIFSLYRARRGQHKSAHRQKTDGDRA